MPQLSTLLLLTLAASNALAGDLYYAFYNDDKCKDGEGTHVDSNNDGCLKEAGRHCLAPAGGHAGLYYPVLVGFSDDNCQNEIGCNALQACDSPECYTSFSDQAFLWGTKASSFKFVSGGAKAPTCPNACTGECPGGHAPTKRTIGKNKKERGFEGSIERDVEQIDQIDAADAKSNDYAFCSNADCTDCGTSIEPNKGGCSIEGSRKSVQYNGEGVVVLSGYRTDDQTCKNDVVDTVRMDHKGCFPLKSGADGGPNAYQVTTFSGS